MNSPLGQSVRMAFAALRAHKIRSLLTLLGIIIGVTAIIGMMAVIRGVQLEMERQMTILQSSVFQVQKYPMVTGFGPHEHQERPNILAEYADEIRQRCPLVVNVAPEVWQFGVSVHGNEKTTPPAYFLAGGGPDFFPNNGYFISEGRAFVQADEDHKRMVAVIGHQLLRELFPNQDPIGQEIKIMFQAYRGMEDAFSGEAPTDFVFAYKFIVVGVIEEKGSMMGRGEDSRVVIPFGTFEKLYGANRSVNITMQARQPEQFEAAQEEVIGVMRQLRGLKPGEPDNFALFSSKMAIDAFNQMTRAIKYSAVGICAIALLVAGIGIMNIMLVSVNERTREIGVRKAVGARSRDILGQFVVEAIVLSEIGGVIGVFTGLGLALVLARVVPGLHAAVPIWAVLLGLGFCSLVGLFFGIYPASRAARLEPIAALRYE